MNEFLKTVIDKALAVLTKETYSPFYGEVGEFTAILCENQPEADIEIEAHFKRPTEEEANRNAIAINSNLLNIVLNLIKELFSGHVYYTYTCNFYYSKITQHYCVKMRFKFHEI